MATGMIRGSKPLGIMVVNGCLKQSSGGVKAVVSGFSESMMVVVAVMIGASVGSGVSAVILRRAAKRARPERERISRRGRRVQVLGA